MGIGPWYQGKNPPIRSDESGSQILSVVLVNTAGIEDDTKSDTVIGCPSTAESEDTRLSNDHQTRWLKLLPMKGPSAGSPVPRCSTGIEVETSNGSWLRLTPGTEQVSSDEVFAVSDDLVESRLGTSDGDSQSRWLLLVPVKGRSVITADTQQSTVSNDESDKGSWLRMTPEVNS
jgi:hypothetical protein